MPLRIDYEYIEAHVPEGARVLDLGCGDGTLLEHLATRRGVEACGIEIDERAVQECIGRGVPVYHGDMLEGMTTFGDRSFDCVILSQTLQQCLQPARVVEEMLRVGRKAIISFPNYGHWKVRLQILLAGRRPRTPLLHYSWYDTPNVHLLSVRDFREFCAARGLHVVDSIFFSPSYARLPSFVANLLAGVAVFVIEKRPERPGRV